MDSIREAGDIEAPLTMLAGASNSLREAFAPLIRQLAAEIPAAAGSDCPYMVGVAVELGQGIVDELRVELDAGRQRIVAAHYDEYFPPLPQTLEDDALRPYIRQSRRHASDYVSGLGMGINCFYDLIGRSIVADQSLERLSQLPQRLLEATPVELEHYRVVAAALADHLDDQLA